jgi:hypothetical protein
MATVIRKLQHSRRKIRKALNRAKQYSDKLNAAQNVESDQGPQDELSKEEMKILNEILWIARRTHKSAVRRRAPQ